MEADGGGDGDRGPRALSMFGIATAAVLGFTLQPMVAIADPVAMLVIGFLMVIVIFGFVTTWIGKVTRTEERFYEVILIALAFAMITTIVAAWRDQQKIDTTCATLQHVMLFEHRHRTDVPEIFRSLGCRIQT